MAGEGALGRLKIQRLRLRPKMYTGRKLGLATGRGDTSFLLRINWRKMGPADVGRKK